MAKELTGPQKLFCEGIANGISQVEAYKAAYPKAKENSVQSNATRLMGNDGVKTHIAELRAKSDSQKALTRRRKRELLHDIAEGKLKETLSPAEIRARLKAIEIDNRMAGHDEPVKIDVTVTQSPVEWVRNRTTSIIKVGTPAADRN